VGADQSQLRPKHLDPRTQHIRETGHSPGLCVCVRERERERGSERERERERECVCVYLYIYTHTPHTHHTHTHNYTHIHTHTLQGEELTIDYATFCVDNAGFSIYVFYTYMFSIHVFFITPGSSLSPFQNFLATLFSIHTRALTCQNF
jgi:hypothetical protein